MKPIYAHFAGALALTFALAACVPQPRAVPPVQTAPAPTPTPSPSPRPSPTPVPDNWIDAAQTAGDWRYSPRQAVFAQTPSSPPKFAMICSEGQITLQAPSANGSAQSMTIRTEFADRTLPVRPVPAPEHGPGTGGAPAYVAARLAARDPLLDAMALTKGRFAVVVPGEQPLYLPSWAEVTRVIEDCR